MLIVDVNREKQVFILEKVGPIYNIIGYSELTGGFVFSINDDSKSARYSRSIFKKIKKSPGRTHISQKPQGSL
jgi:hypothetical protein